MRFVPSASTTVTKHSTVKQKWISHRLSCDSSPPRLGFTLVEVMVLMVIFLLLAAVALPTLKTTLQSQKESQTARQVVAFLEDARSRAIATGQRVGVLLDRAGNVDPFSRSASIQLRQTGSSPNYKGDSDNARAILFHDDYPILDPLNAVPNSRVRDGRFNACIFRPVENPVLLLSAQILNDNRIQNDHLAPIQRGDFITLGSGRRLRILQISLADINDVDETSYTGGGGSAADTPPWEPLNLRFPNWNRNVDGNYIKVRFDSNLLMEAENGKPAETYSWPGGSEFAQPGRRWLMTPYEVHRGPTVSSLSPLKLRRGMAIDLNYSGIGPSGVQFSPFVIDATTGPDNQWVNDGTTVYDFQPIGIVFAPDGSVDLVGWANSALVVNSGRPVGQIFLLLGNSDGIRPDDLFTEDDDARASIMDPASVWIVINPFNGSITTSPNVPPTPPDPTVAIETNLSTTVFEARQLALDSETVESI